MIFMYVIWSMAVAVTILTDFYILGKMAFQKWCGSK